MKKIVLFVNLLFSALTIFSQNNIQSFSINPLMATTLETQNGSRVEIPIMAFVQNGDTIRDDITLEIREILDQDEMLYAGVATETKDEVLISNGMIEINGFYNQQPLEIMPGKTLDISLISTDGRANQKVYTAVQSEEEIVWEKSNIPLRIDTCKNAIPTIVTQRKEVTKERYKEWKKEEESKGYEKRLFGGKSLSIGLGKPKPKRYFINVPVDTIWTCPINTVQYNRFEISSFGFYNIDKPMPYKYRVEFNVLTEFRDFKCFALFDGNRVCVKGKLSAKGFWFRRFPKNKMIRLLLYKRNHEKETVKVFFTKVNSSSKTIRIDQFEEISEGAFRLRTKRFQ